MLQIDFLKVMRLIILICFPIFQSDKYFFSDLFSRNNFLVFIWQFPQLIYTEMLLKQTTIHTSSTQHASLNTTTLQLQVTHQLMKSLLMPRDV